MPLIPSHTLLQTYSATLVLTSYLLLTSPLTLINSGPLWLLGESMHIRPPSFALASAQGRLRPQEKQQQSSVLSNITSTQSDLPQSTKECLALLAFILLLAAVSQSLLATPLRYSLTHLTHLASKSVPTNKSNLSRPALPPPTPQHGNNNSDDHSSEFAEQLHTLYTSQTLFLSLSGLRVLLEGALIAWIYLGYSNRFYSSSPSSFASSSSSADAATIIQQPISDKGGMISMLANRITFTVAMGDMLFWGYLWTVLREEAGEIAGVLNKRRELVNEVEESL